MIALALLFTGYDSIRVELNNIIAIAKILWGHLPYIVNVISISISTVLLNHCIFTASMTNFIL